MDMTTVGVKLDRETRDRLQKLGRQGTVPPIG